MTSLPPTQNPHSDRMSLPSPFIRELMKKFRSHGASERFMKTFGKLLKKSLDGQKEWEDDKPGYTEDSTSS